MISGNRTDGDGGGIVCGGGPVIENCAIVSNSAWSAGGGVSMQGGTFRNCLILGNSVTNDFVGGYGGGVACYQVCLIENCTIVSNSVDGYGGGVRLSQGGTVINSVIWSNTATMGDTNVSNSGSGISYSNTCTDVDLSAYGSGNITNNPRFADTAAGNWRLSLGSPCIDKGTNLVAVTNDLDNVPRPLDGDNTNGAAYDMGAYEFVHPTADTDSDGIPDRWEVKCDLNPTVATGANGASGDPDGDSITNFAEYVADTDPRNKSSRLEIIAIQPQPGGIRIEWQGGSEVTQFLECATNLLTTNSWQAIYTNQPSTPVTNEWIITGTTTPPAFYRIKATR